MTRQRKRLHAHTISKPTHCLDHPEVTDCSHCKYVIHEIIAHEQRWLHIARAVFNNRYVAVDVVQEFYAKKLPGKMHRLNIQDPSFKLIKYIARMVHNFSLDELYRTNKHSLIDAHYYVPGVTRNMEEQVSPNILREIEARDQLSMIQDLISKSEQAMLKRMLTASWSVAEEAINERVTPTAIRARIKRIRAKIEKALKNPPHSA